MIGTSLAHFEITAKLGEGGMGEVYRAEDTKLGRQVAIKVLPEEVAQDAERLARFEREAKVLASLNHPNIAGIHQVEESEGVHFLVMELVEGEDLKERLDRGPLPFEQAQPIVLQIAEALEVAHEKGIVHRDLKPANIKVTPEGQVKILDFGLAKALDPTSRTDAELSLSPTLTAQMTQAGVLLGTAAYMSPEQARGEEVGRQADIWAFGAVVYEMLTAKLSFPGGTVTDVMAAVVSQEPDWDSLPAGTPNGVREVLHLCLAKDPRQRIHDIADARLILTSHIEPEPAETGTAAAPLWSRAIPWGLAAVLAVVAGYLALSASRHSSEDRSVQRFTINLPPEIYLKDNEYLALSPDGRRLVFVGIEDGVQRLFLRDFGSDEVAAIPGTDTGNNPFFSPDGQAIGFTRNDTDELRVLTFATGTASTITESDWGAGAWGPDDTIIFTPYYTSGLHRIGVSGGSSEELTRPDLEMGELGHFFPQHLPDAQQVVFTNFAVPLVRSKIMVLDLSSGETTVLQENGVWGRYAPTGHLLFVRDQTMMAVRMDPATLQTTGAPVPVVSDLRPELGQGDVPATFADNGTLAFVSGSAMKPLRELVWVERTGAESPFPELRRYRHPSISPDGSRIALTIEDKTWDLWALELERGTLSRLTFEANTQFGAKWMPAGDEILYAQDDPPYNIYRRRADGSGQAELIIDNPADSEARSISPDGTTLLYSTHPPNDTNYDLWTVSLVGAGDPHPWIEAPGNQDLAVFSPDGDWVAYASDETGRSEIYVDRFPERGSKLQVSLQGGHRPRWSRDGREIYFRDGPRMMASKVSAGDRFTATDPVELFSGEYKSATNRWDYDVAPDGRFIMVKTPDEDRPREINVILNWFEKLEELVPTQ